MRRIVQILPIADFLPIFETLPINTLPMNQSVEVCTDTRTIGADNQSNKLYNSVFLEIVVPAGVGISYLITIQKDTAKTSYTTMPSPPSGPGASGEVSEPATRIIMNGETLITETANAVGFGGLTFGPNVTDELFITFNSETTLIIEIFDVNHDFSGRGTSCYDVIAFEL